MGATALIMQGAGAVSQAGAAYSQSRMNRAAAEAQAITARYNAQYAEWQAQDALTRGHRAEEATRRRTAQLKGRQVAGFAASGVALDSDSVLNVLTSTDVMGEADALTERDNAKREAWALRVQAQNFESEAAMARLRARSEKPWLAATTTLLGGAASVNKSWFDMSRAGVQGVPKYPGT